MVRVWWSTSSERVEHAEGRDEEHDRERGPQQADDAPDLGVDIAPQARVGLEEQAVARGDPRERLPHLRAPPGRGDDHEGVGAVRAEQPLGRGEVEVDGVPARRVLRRGRDDVEPRRAVAAGQRDVPAGAHAEPVRQRRAEAPRPWARASAAARRAA